MKNKDFSRKEKLMILKLLLLMAERKEEKKMMMTYLALQPIQAEQLSSRLKGGAYDCAVIWPKVTRSTSFKKVFGQDLVESFN